MNQQSGQRRMRWTLLVLSLALSAATDVQLALGRPKALVFVWLLSLVLLVLSAPPAERPGGGAGVFGGWKRSRGGSPWSGLVAVLGGDPPRLRFHLVAIVLLPALVRICLYDLTRAHGDDLLTSYFSAKLDLQHANFFAPVPPNAADWVCQFPSPYFVLQKLFFVAFGESLATVKLSILPYVTIVSVFLWLIARELLDQRAAAISVVLYAFFGPSLYLETLGLDFVSSTAALLGFFYFALLEFRTGEARFALLSGVLAGCCYLSYTSSYIALPLLAVFFFVRGSHPRERRVGKNLILCVLGILAVLGPFAIHSVKTSNYFLGRINQVSLLSGEWSAAKNRIQRGEETALHVLQANLALSTRSLFEPGIAGHGGYEFGHQALFDHVSLALAVLGLLRASWLARRTIEWLFVLLTVAVSWLAGVVLTIPPPAFHRFCIAFPFLALLLALPIHALVSSTRGSPGFRRTLAAIVIAGFVFGQEVYFHTAAFLEHDFEALRMSAVINRLLPRRRLYVAAYPGFAFEKIYYFSPGKSAVRITSDYHGALLPRLDPSEKYVYVIVFPKDFEPQFAARDPNGRMIHLSAEYTLFAN